MLITYLQTLLRCSFLIANKIKSKLFGIPHQLWVQKIPVAQFCLSNSHCLPWPPLPTEKTLPAAPCRCCLLLRQSLLLFSVSPLPRIHITQLHSEQRNSNDQLFIFQEKNVLLGSLLILLRIDGLLFYAQSEGIYQSLSRFHMYVSVSSARLPENRKCVLLLFILSSSLVPGT